MNLVSKLLASAVLSVPLLSGCGGLEWQFERTNMETVGTKQVREKTESEFSYKIKTIISSENVKTETESTLNIDVQGEKRETEIQVFKQVNMITERPVMMYSRNLVTFLNFFAPQHQTKYERGSIITRKEELFSEKVPLPEVVKETFILPGIELNISSDKDLFFDGKNPLTIKADENGKATSKISTKTYAMNLEELVKANPLFNEFQPSSKEVRDALLKDGIVEIPLPYTIKIKPGVYEGIPYSEAVATGTAKFKAVSSEFLNQKVSEFVNAKVNPSLKTLVLTARDIDSHILLKRATYVLSTKSPSAEELLKPYFSGSMLKVAQNHLDAYERGDRTIENGEATVTLKVAPGSEIKIETTNPKYNFYKGEFKVTEDAKKTIELSELGEKTRVRIVDE